MQTLRDAAILLGLLLVVSSVRVSRVDPVPLDLVPPVHAGVAGSSRELFRSEHATRPATAEPATPQAPRTVSPDACQVRMLRLESPEAGATLLVVRDDLVPATESTPRARKIG